MPRLSVSRSFFRGICQGGAVTRSISSGNQVRVGQYGAMSRICSSSSLILHSVSARRLTGEMHTCEGPAASCVPVRRPPCRLMYATVAVLSVRTSITGRRFGGRLEWLGPTACRSATPTSGLGHGASVEAVSYGAAPAAWLPPQPPYAPRASETVSVVPPSCSWTYSSS